MRLEQSNPLGGKYAEDFALMKDTLRNTCIGAHVAFNQNWVYAQKFIGVSKEEGYVSDGFDLSEDAVFTINCQCPGPLVHTVFAVTERILTLNNGEVTLS